MKQLLSVATSSIEDQRIRFFKISFLNSVSFDECLSSKGIGFASPKASCLVGIGAGIKLFIDAAKAADMIITIDGCEIGCAKKVIENVGLTAQNFILTKLGLKKGETIPSPELSDQLVQTLIGSIQ